MLNLKPETLNLKPETLNLKPETLNLKPETLNLKPETLKPKPETKREFFFDDQLVRIHLITDMILVDQPRSMAVPFSR